MQRPRLLPVIAIRSSASVVVVPRGVNTHVAGLLFNRFNVIALLFWISLRRLKLAIWLELLSQIALKFAVVVAIVVFVVVLFCFVFGSRQATNTYSGVSRESLFVCVCGRLVLFCVWFMSNNKHFLQCLP